MRLQQAHELEQVVTRHAKGSNEQQFIRKPRGIGPVISNIGQQGSDREKVEEIDPGTLGRLTPPYSKSVAVVTRHEETDGQQGQVQPFRRACALISYKEKQGRKKEQVKQGEKKVYIDDGSTRHHYHRGRGMAPS